MAYRSRHEGHRQSFLKAVELALDSGRLGTGDKSDLLDIARELGFQYTRDIRLERLEELVTADNRDNTCFMKCPKCTTPMVLGQAIKVPPHEERCCRGMGGHLISSSDLKLVECWKCPKCGHSEELNNG